MHAVGTSLKKFARVFFHPRIFIFILTGTVIIFLTFLTSNNALEIAISGIASVFIGIGVNNFSTLETHQKDQQKYRQKIDQSIEVLQVVDTWIIRLQQNTAANGTRQIKQELSELQQFTDLMIRLLQKEGGV